MSRRNPLTPEQRTMRAKLAAHALHAQVDSKMNLAGARQGFKDKFIRSVDPDGVLPPAERERRAQSALKAHMLRLALKSSKARAVSSQERDRRAQRASNAHGAGAASKNPQALTKGARS